MKKLAILTLVILFGVGLSSCKKDWTCKCEDNNGDISGLTEISNVSKDDAETTCNDLEGNNEDCSLVGQ